MLGTRRKGTSSSLRKVSYCPHPNPRGDAVRARTAMAVRPVGRINFILRTIVVTAMAFGVRLLGEGLLHLDQLPQYLFVLQRVAVFGLVGLFLFRTIDGRLLDAGLARWYRFPVFALWLVSMSLPVIVPQWSPLGPALFTLLLILGGVIPGKLVPVQSSATREFEYSEDQVSMRSRRAPSLPMVHRIDFLRSLLTLTCLWLPLIWLEDFSGNHLGAWIARLGYSILCVVWAVKVIGRLEDAGKAPSVRQGLLVILLILSIELMRHLELHAWTQWWQSFPVLKTAAGLSQWLVCLNGYEKLALFLLVQVPLALLPGKPKLATPFSEYTGTSRNARQPVEAVKTNVLALCGPFEYLRILLVIASVSIPLIYMDHVSKNGVGSWIARAGYAVLAFFWLTFAHGRLKDAGWAHSEYPSQFFLVVSVASLMPLAVHWVNGFGAIAIFVIVQIPTAFLKSVPIPDEEL
jgi:hypothetical protein